ncbi:MAG: TVP38/TMEM64 family protein [Phenylobacterium sp.]
MRRPLRFLTEMDRQAWWGLAVSFLLFGGVGLVFLFGARLMGFDSETALRGWLGAAHGPWALPAAVAAFAALAFLGAPQFVLIAAAVVAFGPVNGAIYSWVGTMVSAMIGFWLGRSAGARTLQMFSSESLDRFMALVGRNGFLASLVVRLVPSAPFIVVNMAAGVTPIRVLDFAAGTALGIIPKIALTAFAGKSILHVLTGGGAESLAALAAGLVLWIALGLAARRWLRSRAGP